MDSGNSLRERLIDVGVELVTAEGSGAVGLREIARRAGVSHGAPRRYFPTHQSLLSAVARRGFAELAVRFAAVDSAAASPRWRLRALGTAYVDYALEHRGMFELMFRHDLLDSTGLDAAGLDDAGREAAGDGGGPRLRESTLPLFALLVSLVSGCGARDPQVTAAALWANLHGVAQLWGAGTLPLALGSGPQAGVAPLVAVVLDAHLGPEPA